MKLSVADLDFLINAIVVRPFQHDEIELLAKLRRMRKGMEETNELEASEN